MITGICFVYELNVGRKLLLVTQQAENRLREIGVIIAAINTTGESDKWSVPSGKRSGQRLCSVAIQFCHVRLTLSHPDLPVYAVNSISHLCGRFDQ